ncbi:MAG TPA: MoaD/ThiS family protein, partial [Candidatus Eisenbacteria bacterium]|nr:MoaD/ThiS family protein [Candidatus Eisenbacteria bacterium]
WQDLAQDSRWIALDRMRAHRNHRGRLDHARAGTAPDLFVSENVAGFKIVSTESAPQSPEISVPITFHIPGALREFTEGRAVVEVSVLKGTLSEALISLWTLHPGVRDRVINEQGQLRQHINIFVGNENSRYTGGLATPVSDGAEISIVPAVSGGVFE